MASEQLNILIFGLGAVGAVYGLILDRGGCNITAVCRSNHAAVKQNGILLRSPLWGHQRYVPRAVQTTSEATADGTTYDYIIVASKAFPGTAQLLQPAVAPGRTAIVLAQNGIGLEAEYAALYPSNTIISGVVYLPVTQVEPGIVEHASNLQRFEIGTYPPSATASAKAQTQLHTLSDRWTAGNANAPIFTDIQPTKWKKLAINAAWNPITALTMCDDANFLRSATPCPDEAEQTIRGIMHEVGLVATAAGYPGVIDEEFIASDLQRPRDRLSSGGKEPSMLVDVKMGRRMEVEAILGNTVRMADELGVGGKVPGLRLLYALARAREFALLKPASVEGREGWGPIARH